MELVSSPRRHLHPIMEESYNSAGELSEEETHSNCSEYSENQFLSEDSLEVSDKERCTRRGDSGPSGLSEYFISSLTQQDIEGSRWTDEPDAFWRAPSHLNASHSPSSIFAIPYPAMAALQGSECSSDSGDFSCDSLNKSCDFSLTEDVISAGDEIKSNRCFKPDTGVNRYATTNPHSIIELTKSDALKTPQLLIRARNADQSVTLNPSLVSVHDCAKNRPSCLSSDDFGSSNDFFSFNDTCDYSGISSEIGGKYGGENYSSIPCTLRNDAGKFGKSYDSGLVSLDSLDASFDCDAGFKTTRDVTSDSANWSFESRQCDVIDRSCEERDDGFFESLNRSFDEMNENLQSIKQISVQKFEDTIALRGYLENCESFHALLEKYVSLKNRAEGVQTEIKLKAEMAQLKDDIIALAENVLSTGTDKIDRSELEKYINQMKKELESLQDRKLKLTLVNLKVHQFKAESGVSVDDLKAEVAKLYQIWDYNYNRVSSQLESLQRVSNIWKQFEAHRNEFMSALGGDEKTIQLLDTALQDGDISPDIATSVRVVAKVLSEKHDDNSPPESLTESLSVATSLLDPCSGEGSLSDSGISDSGSEQDICEREKRLGEIRKLAKEMDLLSPGSLFAMDVNKRVQEMESKLRELQRNCRNLIVKTAVCAETSCPAAPRKRILLTSQRSKSPVLKEEFIATADDESDGSKPSQFWRILKCSMPFHLAIMLLVCVACLLEPHCCDSLNNFHHSIAPQMRYLYGPPPI